MIVIPPIGWTEILSAILILATVVIIVVYRDQMPNRLIAGIVLVLVSSSLLSIESVTGLAIDTTLASILLSGAALVLFLSLWWEERTERKETDP
jgi:drug/metabolite transporter (DMT)-like permease